MTVRVDSVKPFHTRAPCYGYRCPIAGKHVRNTDTYTRPLNPRPDRDLFPLVKL